MFYVYVLFSKKCNKFYIGYSDDLKQRLKEHQLRQVQTTSRMVEPKLIYYEACVSKMDATHRERQLKTGFGREYLRKRLKNSI